MSQWNPSPNGGDLESQFHREIHRQSNFALPMRSTSQYTVQRRGSGTSLKFKTIRGLSSTKLKVREMVLHTILGYDCMICRPYGLAGADSSQDIVAAAPPELRRAITSETFIVDSGTETWEYAYPESWDGTQSRIATRVSDSLSVTQYITPRWFEDELVLVADCDVVNSVIVDGGITYPITRVILTGREWAEKYSP